MQQVPPQAFLDRYGLDENYLAMVVEPPAPYGNGGNCIVNQGMVGTVLVVMVCFSLCVQAAEGLHYGIVPYVSRPALGIVSGMVGAGGNLGGVVALRAFFFGGVTRTDTGYVNLGIFVICITATMFGIYFPDTGGMLFKAGALGKYDPQLIKPPADYKGMDQISLDAKPGTRTGAAEASSVETAKA